MVGILVSFWDGPIFRCYVSFREFFFFFFLGGGGGGSDNNQQNVCLFSGKMMWHISWCLFFGVEEGIIYLPLPPKKKKKLVRWTHRCWTFDHGISLGRIGTMCRCRFLMWFWVAILAWVPGTPSKSNMPLLEDVYFLYIRNGGFFQLPC